MPAPSSFDYAVIRVVPRVEREEFVNAGIVLFCLQRRFLQARIHIDEQRLLALWPRLDAAAIETIRRHLEAFPSICAGDPSAGPISQLSQRERFHWLVSPRSTIIQVSPVHTGLCDTTEEIMDNLVQRYLVL
jgi:hypothetical protein